MLLESLVVIHLQPGSTRPLTPSNPHYTIHTANIPKFGQAVLQATQYTHTVCVYVEKYRGSLWVGGVTYHTGNLKVERYSIIQSHDKGQRMLLISVKAIVQISWVFLISGIVLCTSLCSHDYAEAAQIKGTYMYMYMYNTCTMSHH